MLALRDAHEYGPTRVSIDGAHVLTGGSDGVVALFPLKRWPQSASLWARQCHSAAVTFVVLQDDLHLAVSCGRDGHVLLHENVHAVSAEASTSRLICKVTGEVRCMHFDTVHRRLLLAGDSLRCLQMVDGRFEVRTVPLVVPSPIAAVALSPCGTLLAMASTSGAVGVVSAHTTASGAAATSTSTPTNDAVAIKHEVRLALDKVLSSSISKDDRCAFRMQWCRTAGGLHLLVPATAEVTLLRYTEPNHSTGAPAKLRAVGGLHADGLTNFFSVAAYPVSAHRACCLMACREGIFIGKFDDRAFLMTRHASQSYVDTVVSASTAVTAARVASEDEGDANMRGKDGRLLTDVHVCEATGDVVVGLACGSVSVLPRASLKALDERKETEKKEKREEAKRHATVGGCSGANVIDAETQDGSQASDAAGFQKHRSDEATHRHRMTKRAEKAKKQLRSSYQSRSMDDDGFIDDAECESGVDDDEEGDTDGPWSSSDSDSHSESDSASDSDRDSNDQLAVRENLKRVVVDLKASNADYIDNDEQERPSRWRDEDPRRVLADAEKEARRHREGAVGAAVSSRFLDDEAEEGSGSDESDDSASHGNVRRHRRNDNRGSDDDDDDDDDLEEVEEAVGSDMGDDFEAGLIAGRNGDRNATRGVTSGATSLLDYSFQVGATPSGAEESCYLAYNSTGFIVSTREGTTVHFHDVSNPAVRITERGVILMGTLSPVGAGFLVASAAANTNGDGFAAGSDGLAESVDEDAPRLTVYYRTFVALGAQSDWRARLQPGETVRCMTAGIRHLAVATNRYLRIYSLSGLELAVLSKFPRIVAMAGTSSRRLMSGLKADFDPLAVVYLEGGEHKMEVMDVGSRSVAIPSRPLPLTEGGGLTFTGDSEDVYNTNNVNTMATHQLQWLGWSEDGPLHTVDTAGVVRMYTESWGGSWVPVYDPRSLSDQSYTLWVWGVNDEHLYAYRSLKSEAPYPAAVATGLPVERAPLFVPLTRTATAAGDRETVTWDRMLRHQIRADELKRHSAFYSASIAKHDAVHDAKIAELFRSAVRAQMTSRAMDLATLLELRDNIEDCARVANSSGHAQLVQKLLMLYEMRVKAKSKRRCELPLEKSMVSEKERDELLRKLLVRERNGGKASNSASSNSANTCGNDDYNKSGSVPAASTAIEVENDTVSDSPVKSVATTAVTATTDRSPPARGTESGARSASSNPNAVSPDNTTSARRRVTFNVPEGDVARHPSEASTASSAALTTTVAKPANPFAAKKAGNRPMAATFTARAPTTSAATSVGAARSDAKTARVQTSLIPPSSTLRTAVKRTTFQTSANPTAFKPDATPTVTSPAMAGSPTSLLGVDSQPTELTETQLPASEEDARAVDAIINRAAATFTPPRAHAHTRDGDERAAQGNCQGEGEGEEEGASGGGRRPSEELSPSGGRPTGTTPTAARDSGKPSVAANSVMHGETAGARPNFIARTLPVNADSTSSAKSGSRRAPFDPFLVKDPQSSAFTMENHNSAGSGSSLVIGGTSDAEGAPVSVEALLDVGHEDSQSTAPRSSSFGEALRKRYRADEEDENSDDVVVPLTSFARVEG